jgi:hypothetical protein
MVFGAPMRIVLLAVVILLPASIARADVNQQDANFSWRQSDKCMRDALKQFPDHTPQGNAKREAARLQCLRNHKLPAPASAAGSAR